MFAEENPRSSLLNNYAISFGFNPFNYEITSSFTAKLVPFHQTITDFYLQEPIAANSSVRGECALFLGRESNFHREV